MSLEYYLNAFLKKSPSIHPKSYIAQSAEIIGDVHTQANSSLWSLVVARADLNTIYIGENTNIQEASVLHVTEKHSLKIGKNVTVGHKALLHACTIQDNCLIGMHATILDGAVISEGSIVGACALVTQNMIIPPRSLVLGIPAKVVKSIDPDQYDSILLSAQNYIEMAQAIIP